MGILSSGVKKMGIGFYKEPNEKDEDTFAVFSNNSDLFLYKNMSLKELAFFYMSQGADLNNIKMELQYRLRDLKLDQRNKEEQQTYKDAKSGYDLNYYFIENVTLYLMPLLIEKDKFLLYNSFEDSVQDIVLSQDEVYEYLDNFYLNMFSKKYLDNFIGMSSQTHYSETIRHSTFDEEKKALIYEKIDELIKK